MLEQPLTSRITVGSEAFDADLFLRKAGLLQFDSDKPAVGTGAAKRHGELSRYVTERVRL